MTKHPAQAVQPQPTFTDKQLWASLWSLVVGFFMILLDSTIVSVANPAIMKGLNLGNDYAGVLWVTSSYLLAYAVPLLVMGRLGDKYGPKRVYLGGLVVFTLASLWCGLAGMLPGGGLAMLVVARAVQGVGASAMSPQTMSIITRTFPPARRGEAMGLWGAAAGIASLVGPIAGGLLVDAFGWESIFFVNVPIGIVAFIAAMKFVPRLPTSDHSFDLVGVALFVIGMFLIVFGIQEGEAYRWGTITGIITIPAMIIVGVVFLALFVVWQGVEKGEPLMPLDMLRDRNFSLANTAISAVGFAVTCVPMPLIFYLQSVRGLTPTQGALLLAPSAIVSALLARGIGRLVDKVENPRTIVIPAVLLFVAGTLMYSLLAGSVTTPLWLFAVASAISGIGVGGLFGPVSTTANRSLPPQWAGAGSGLFNTTRQLGAVLGSACVAALMEARIGVRTGSTAGSRSGAVGVPDALKEPFSLAMSDTLLLPCLVLVVTAMSAAFFVPPPHKQQAAKARAAKGASTASKKKSGTSRPGSRKPGKHKPR